MTEYVIDVKGLRKQFGSKTAVDDVSLQVKQGEIFGFLGPNGSGKTTTIRMLCGLMQPDAGAGTCLGYDIITQSYLIKPLVGYVPQTFSLYKDLTVYENLIFVARANNKDNYVNRVNEIINDLLLTPYKKILTGKLSGGWKQRVSLAAALLNNPRLLLLDEPTAGVDPKTRREFWNTISKLTTQGITVLLSTHYMDEAERCNRLAYIVNGKLMIQGTIKDIIRKVDLTTWSAEGANVLKLAIEIEKEPEVEQVVPWGNALRISGTNGEYLDKLVKQYAQFKWEKVDTSLEEVFIHLVNERVSDIEAKN
ncbi:ABC transporter ATP-binding protein (plasmid) [Legionella adelaidensis]|uniref:ABC transporter ATP-binding protein n=1 Tax=Legionella adelaidensis TaxID=45056 RepID=A0A0W0R419_9GAMM|nr:ABC transporter ATP-binding protein [Legionella adelaidensis]KTC65816.1 ABC transporter ATP-binding protein [Legionella adelaidensis]VEH85245.1 ABC transporter ATP-binding protein [Legionella adelaidensis]